jgi:hypothetical protein
MITLTLGTLLLIFLIGFSLGTVTIWLITGNRKPAMFTVLFILPVIVIVTIRLLGLLPI